MIRPPRGCCSFIARNASCAQRKEPVRLVATIVFQSSSFTSSIGEGTPKLPALLKSRSMRPKSLRAVSTSVWTEPGSVTSVWTTSARSESPAVSPSVSVRRPASATCQPASSSARETTRPIPEPAPVTTAVRSMRGISPDLAVAPVARQLAGHVELHRYGQHEHRPVVLLGADDPGRRQRTGRPFPEPPSERGIEAQAVVGRRQRSQVVPAADDPLDRFHERPAVALATPVLAHREALDVAGAQRAPVVDE